MRHWWVNQNQTYRSEVPGGFLWSPKTRADGARNHFYENMREVAPGDVVFSFCDTRIKAIGLAVGRAESSPKPDFGGAGSTWASEGWLVPVEFEEFGHPIRPKDHIEALRPHLPGKYSPLQHSGDGLQSVYLTELPPPLATALIAVIGEAYASSLTILQSKIDAEGSDDEFRHAEAMSGRTDIGETSKRQLLLARRGQGVFKANVRLNETRCRVTGVNDPRHLRASHIKPWRACDDVEKLDGCNGLLLAPHIDHLFDQGFISFADEGKLLISPRLDRSILTRWSIPGTWNAGPFNDRQHAYLHYHRNHVFKHGG
ncbi:HNH endonuclease [Pseudomarimonas arenosa]|uniref:HNH endonuclease n=1 Tax=Pseudomarimonas arenosa TaxID=2774145 RepID=A0AAW3ZJ07_9GAMM|nr:HNH endonuclease signature motif containing protein [Pseudomarimonas arenosa]MBD8524441.1 HNH endonuclease [Pseudomarimonas arenosa]